MLAPETEPRPSDTIEDYLQSIYSLETEGERIISARLARWMRVTPPTAWATVQRMHRDGMVDIDASSPSTSPAAIASPSAFSTTSSALAGRRRTSRPTTSSTP